jgi:uncharacterized protein YhbP (UPF0306 family)
VENSTNDSYDLTKKALELLHSQHILTLATCDGKSPWASSVYYVLSNKAFYFFSNPDSRHIVNSRDTRVVAGEVHDPSSSWSDIRGVQMEGTIEEGGFDIASTSAYALYIGRFTFIREMGKMPLSPMMSLAALETSFKVAWYKFVPSAIYYLDNSIRFGYRERVEL